MDVEDAIRSRRTHKAFGPEPVPRAVLDELLELGRWAPNHHLTNPWRFRVIGPVALARLKDAAGPEAAAKLDHAPTLVAATVVGSEDPVEEQEDLCATACAVYAVLPCQTSRTRIWQPASRFASTYPTGCTKASSTRRLRSASITPA